MVKASPFIHQPDQVVQKVSDVLAADWWYHAYMKKYDIFSCIHDCYGFSQGSKSLYNTTVYVMKWGYWDICDISGLK